MVINDSNSRLKEQDTNGEVVRGGIPPRTS